MQIMDSIKTKEKEFEKISQAADIIAQKDIAEVPTRSELAANEIGKNDELAGFDGFDDGLDAFESFED